MSHPPHWLPAARRCPSPNQDPRPEGCPVDLLVVHNISLPPDQFGGPWIEDLFLNRLDPNAHPYFADIAHLTVSAHVLIRRDGEVVQFVPLDARAWHAGASCHDGRERCNDYAIGIELEGSDLQPFSDAQYDALVAVTRQIMDRYPLIDTKRIVGHRDIAPGRKTDPGPYFDWHRYHQALTQACKHSPHS